jgi:hypothetical protein
MSWRRENPRFREAWETRQTSRYTPLGPGDEATWPPYSGDPNDPRHVDDPDYEEEEAEDEDYD